MALLCMCVCWCTFVWTITFIFMYGFQNGMAELMCNLGGSNVKVALLNELSLVILLVCNSKPHSKVDSLQDLRKGGRCFDPLAQPIFFLRINYSHCNRIHSSLTTVHCFIDDYVGKQPVA